MKMVIKVNVSYIIFFRKIRKIRKDPFKNLMTCKKKNFLNFFNKNLNFKKSPGSPIFFNVQIFFLNIHCRPYGSLLTKFNNKPTYKSQDNCGPQKFYNFRPWGEPLRTNQNFFSLLYGPRPRQKSYKIWFLYTKTFASY